MTPLEFWEVLYVEQSRFQANDARTWRTYLLVLERELVRLMGPATESPRRNCISGMGLESVGAPVRARPAQGDGRPEAPVRVAGGPAANVHRAARPATEKP